ncbi:MAG: xanthine dehydrogenase family protein molybdopterin-binding subunit [Rhodobacteraceae bacterium]|nr:xanthine dehydrogenase family protein molybdopterin-binding subunit [Paracoccaceae bacterium]
MKFGVGQSVKRVEDVRLLSGLGSYSDDLAGANALHVHVVRSSAAHARIKGTDVDQAHALPGVHAVLTGADYAADGIGGMACATIFPGVQQNVKTRAVPAIAQDRVLYAGMAVAVIVAETRQIARDAAELIEINYEDLPVVIDARTATAPGAPALWDDAPGNIGFVIDFGDAGATQAALDKSAHVTRLCLHNNRVSANALEPRATVCRYDRRDGRLTIHTSTQVPHTIRTEIAGALGIPQTQVRVQAGDVGGGFGMKGCVYAEDILTAWAAHRLRRDVRWQADRSESLLADYHGRDQVLEAELGLDADGKITALRIHCDFNTGAFLAPGAGVPPLFAAALATGCYRVPVANVVARAVYTNTSPTQPYRGAGRPEASYLIERLMDKAARETGRDRIDLRRANMLSVGDMPYKTPLVYTIDTGDYAKILDKALEMIGWDDIEARKAEAKTRGKLLGYGIALHMENAGLGNESVEVRFDPGGSVTALVGTFSHGQGHETVYAQMLSDWLGVPFDRIRVVQGDTDAVSFGRGTVASRSMINGGGSLKIASDQVIEKARMIAAHLMEVAPDDVVFEAGELSVAGTDRKMRIEQVAALSFKPILPEELGIGLSGQGNFKLEGFTFPNGCQIAEVEVDPETGAVEIVRMVSADDVGTVINPMLLDGQMVGGIAQGIGQALMEDLVYDETGQLLTGSFMDYAMPRAADMPPIRVETVEVDLPGNPVKVKGAGEAGTVGATPAVISAVLDALAPLGVEDIALPATPQRVWAAIQAARAS